MNLIKKIFKKNIPVSDKDIDDKFVVEYSKLSKKYNRSLSARLVLLKDGNIVNGEEEKELTKEINTFLNQKKIGILPIIRVEKNDTK